MRSQNTRLHLKEMIENHKLAILALLETKVHRSQVLNFLENIDFLNLWVVESMGYVGGIMVVVQ